MVAADFDMKKVFLPAFLHCRGLGYCQMGDELKRPAKAPCCNGLS